MGEQMDTSYTTWPLLVWRSEWHLHCAMCGLSAGAGQSPQNKSEGANTKAFTRIARRDAQAFNVATTTSPTLKGN